MNISYCPGHVHEALSLRDPGNINLARWVTLANRLLRLYVPVSELSNELTSLVHYVMDVYAPSWFEIKRNCKMQHGALNQFHMMERARNLSLLSATPTTFILKTYWRL